MDLSPCPHHTSRRTAPAAAGFYTSALAALQLLSLKVMCHMATTPAGRSRMAAAGCLPRWVCRAPEVEQKQLLVLVLLPLACVSDWTGRLYWETLYRGGQQVEMRAPSEGVDVEAYRRSCPPLLRQQVRPLACRSPCHMYEAPAGTIDLDSFKVSVGAGRWY
jgi:hypothetical protein